MEIEVKKGIVTLCVMVLMAFGLFIFIHTLADDLGEKAKEHDCVSTWVNYKTENEDTKTTESFREPTPDEIELCERNKQIAVDGSEQGKVLAYIIPVFLLGAVIVTVVAQLRKSDDIDPDNLDPLDRTYPKGFESK